jgi:sRNA-binding regulator protein Hfq
MTELDITLPSIRHIHHLIRDRKNSDSSSPNFQANLQNVEVKLITGDLIVGSVKWIDIHCICVEGKLTLGDKPSDKNSDKNQEMLIWHHAIAFIKS